MASNYHRTVPYLTNFYDFLFTQLFNVLLFVFLV